MLNGIFVAVISISILLAAFTGQMEALTQASIKSAKDAVELAFGLIGVMAFFLGLMRVAEQAGLLSLLARALRPILRLLFPTIPHNHPAMGAIILNMASNILGLGNAATPFGIKALTELDYLEKAKGTASNNMVLFLAINTAGLAILPTSMIALRASANSTNAAAILVPTWIAGSCATLVAVLAARFLSRLPFYKKNAVDLSNDKPTEESNKSKVSTNSIPDSNSPETTDVLATNKFITWKTILALLFVISLLVAIFIQLANSWQAGTFTAFLRGIMSYWVLPALIILLILFGWIKGIKVYECLVEGAKEGFNVAIRIIPYLVAILVMVGMFRASGGLNWLTQILGPLTSKIGLPAEVLPVAILRPLSGSGTLGLVAELFKTHGADSFIGYLASTIYGSTETTFYILAVYFGAIGIKNSRHAIPTCLIADSAGILAGVLAVHILFHF